MKKIFTLLVSLGTLGLGSAFAQYGSYSHNQRDSRNTGYQSTAYNQPNYGRNSNTVSYGHYDQQQNNRGYNDRQRQEGIDRVNRDYDKRIGDYRNDRSLSSYERNRRIQMAERERNTQLKSFGGGVILGGILGVLIGSHL